MALTSSGYTSKVFVDAERQYVLKLSRTGFLHTTMAARELCVIRALQRRGFDWIPRVLCIDNPYDPKAFVMLHAGQKVSSDNLPADYREQFLRIMDDMKVAGVSHNDLKYNRSQLVVSNNKRNGHGPRVWTYKELEIYVTPEGRLHLVDFNMATMHSSYRCADEFGESRAQTLSTFEALGYRRPDADALAALDELHHRSKREKEIEMLSRSRITLNRV